MWENGQPAKVIEQRKRRRERKERKKRGRAQKWKRKLREARIKT